MVPCEKCDKMFLPTSILRHIQHVKACKAFYGARIEDMKKKRKEEFNTNRDKEKRKIENKNRSKEKIKITNKNRSKEKRKKSNEASYKKNEEVLRKTNREYAQNKRADSDVNLANFKKETEFGPEFICVCCHGSLFEKEVYDFNEKRRSLFTKNFLEDTCDFKDEFYDPRGKGRKFICISDFRIMTQNKKPPRSIKNGLEVDALKLPKELADIDPLENTMIARSIPFMKIQLVPKSSIEKMTDRVVLVPIEPSDIIESIESTLLPRSMADSAVIAIDFKRMKDLKNNHLKGHVRPMKLVKALAYLKDCGNQYYNDVIIKCLFCPKQFDNEEKDVLDHIEKCQMDFQANEGVSEIENECGNENDIEIENDDGVLPTIKKYQAQDDVSCIQIKDPEINVIFNASNAPKQVPVKDSATGKSVILAPGEGKIPSVIMREIDFDVKAFPLKHPSGQFGLNYERAVKLSKQQYFRARLFHYSNIFANDNEYLFMCQQYIERAALEAQINISVQKGVMNNNSDGTKTMHLKDAFSVFRKIPGTPKYWQQKKYNLLAMINVLGPFQWFFTFSCAELNWPQIIVTILRKKGRNVTVLDPAASTANAGIKVDDEPLTDYLKRTGQTLRGLIKHETVLVTRIFDKRVKSFINNILMDQGAHGMKLKNYVYRVEFQARLAPHIHGCAWMKEEVIEKHRVEGSFEYKTDDKEFLNMISTHVSCQLPEDEVLRRTVEELQTHKCTNTCTKKGPECRFGFPRLPSNETLIALPVDKSDEDAMERFKSGRLKLDKVRAYLDSAEFDNSLTLQQILDNLRIEKEDYENALRMSNRGKQVILKRKPNERRINNYNKQFISAYQANMDIQFCTDAFAVMTYMCDYWAKDETLMTRYLKLALKEAKTLTNKDLLSHLKRTYMSKRQVGKCEAVYRAIPTMHLQGSNIGCTFVQSGYPQNQSKFLRKVKGTEIPKKAQENVNSDRESESDGDSEEGEENIELDTNQETLIRVSGRQGLFMETKTMNEKYNARPEGVETITLSQFATSYTKCQKKPKNITFNSKGVTDETGFIIDHITEEPLPRYIKMSTNEIYRLRGYSTVLRIHTSSKKAGEEAYFAEMQLYSPWRFKQLDTWTEAGEIVKEYRERKDIIKTVREKTFLFSMSELIEEIKAQQALDQISDEIGDRMDAQGAHDDLDVLDQDVEDIPGPTIDFSDWRDDDNFGEHNVKNTSNKFKSMELQTKERLLAITKTLVTEQRVVLQKVLDLAKSVVQCRNSNLSRDSPHQMGVILHGGGGVGKSQTITVCAQWAEHILRRAGGDQNKPRILLMCPTGMAASVIDGMTICSSLSLPFGTKYQGLDAEPLDRIRTEFEELKLVIIDEMSMVGADDLYRIHHRFTDIFSNTLPFGGLSIMFVGDMLQLKPVRGRYIFAEPANENNALYYNETSLWHGLEAITLKHNHRQGEGSKFMETLNRMRTGDQNEDDIKLLRSRCITKMSKKFPHDAVNLFYTNPEVNNHNIIKLNKLKTKLYSIKFLGDYPSTYTPTISKYKTVDDTGLCEILKIKVGARVMVVINVNTADSLVNGMIGVVLDILTEPNGKVRCIIVKFDVEKAGAEQRKQYSHIADKYKEHNGTPIFRQKVRYHLTGAGNKPHAVIGTCFQFPIKLAFAITGHKMQGQTIKRGSKLVVNWSNRLPSGLAYVMCSRTESIDDLFIAGQFDPKKIMANSKALEEAKRLDEISLANRPRVIPHSNILLSFGFVNIRSVNANFEFLEDDEVMKEHDIIFVTETWMDAKSDKTYNINGYHSAFANGKTGRGKGVGVFFKKDASIEVCEEELYQFIKLKNESVTIFCLYISKGCQFSQIVQSLKDFGFYNQEENTCLIGDLNFDVSKTNDLSRYLSRMEFKQLVCRATQLDGHILDHVYVPEAKSNLVEIKHHYVYYSDHDGILVTVKKNNIM